MTEALVYAFDVDLVPINFSVSLRSIVTRCQSKCDHCFFWAKAEIRFWLIRRVENQKRKDLLKTFSLSLSLSHIHSHTHTLSLALSFSLSLTFSFSGQVLKRSWRKIIVWSIFVRFRKTPKTRPNKIAGNFSLKLISRSKSFNACWWQAWLSSRNNFIGGPWWDLVVG